jgi:spermidine synthase
LLSLFLSKSAPYEAEDENLETIVAKSSWPIYLSIALSGMTALACEVLWTRTLTLLFGATVYTFSLIVAVFLVGLGIGSTLGIRVVSSNEAAASCVGLVPGPVVRGNDMGGIYADGVAAVVADRSVDRDDSSL